MSKWNSCLNDIAPTYVVCGKVMFSVCLPLQRGVLPSPVPVPLQHNDMIDLMYRCTNCVDYPIQVVQLLGVCYYDLAKSMCDYNS